MTLHLVNKSAESGSALAQCLALLAPGAAILLLEDGVYAALDLPANRQRLAKLPERRCQCFALAEDIAARGIRERLLPQIEVVDYARFVDLCLEYEKVVNWG